MSTTLISKEMFTFLNAWRIWVNKGALDGVPFKRSEGLCFSIQHVSATMRERDKLIEEMFHLLAASFPTNASYPFGGVLVYGADYREYTMHLNKKRRQWVTERLQEYSRAEFIRLAQSIQEL